MQNKKRILIIEDELDISRVLKDYLTSCGFEAVDANNGAKGLVLLENWTPNYIIIDLMLPDFDGLELCRRIREISDTPILILSARGSDTDKVIGLGFGADDYMTKPFSLNELAARINAYFRRYGSMQSTSNESDAIQAGSLRIDKKSYSVTMNGENIELSAKEFELLYHIASHPNQVFTKSQLLDAVWGYPSHGDENTIPVYISRIREKIEASPASPSYIKTVWGVGYKFVVE